MQAKNLPQEESNRCIFTAPRFERKPPQKKPIYTAWVGDHCWGGGQPIRSCSTGGHVDSCTAAPSKSTPNKQRAQATPCITTACPSLPAAALMLSDPAVAASRNKVNPQVPSLLPPHCSQALAGLQQAASAAAVPSSNHGIPSMPNLTLCTPGLGLATFPPLQTGAAALQAFLVALPPFWHPWFPMVMLAAASALAMPRPLHGQIPAAPHCLTWPCSPNPATAGDGLGPHRGMD